MVCVDVYSLAMKVIFGVVFFKSGFCRDLLDAHGLCQSTALGIHY